MFAVQARDDRHHGSTATYDAQKKAAGSLLLVSCVMSAKAHEYASFHDAHMHVST